MAGLYWIRHGRVVWTVPGHPMWTTCGRVICTTLRSCVAAINSPFVKHAEGRMERLQLDRICDIIYRLRRGQLERAIAKDLGHSRITDRHYHQLAREQGHLGAPPGLFM